MNALKESKTSSIPKSSVKSYTNGTIRSVPSQIPQLNSIIPENIPHSESKDSQMPHSTKSDATYNPSNSKLPIYISNATVVNGVNRSAQMQISTDFSHMVPYVNTNNNPNMLSTSPRDDMYTTSAVGPWTSAVGRAGLGGKSGRVIERLMGENDMLKRDLNIERLRAEEHKQAVKMAEGRMETLVAEYEGKLHDAAINKSMLKRKERQLADLRAQVETEKTKANTAVESERVWKEEIEKLEKKTKHDIEEALNYAAMMEARNNAMTNHWKDQGQEVDRAVVKISKEIKDIVLERKQDDERLNTLQGLCDQQATQLSEIVRERDAIVKKYEEYKSTQEDSLRDIKTTAKEQEEKNERILSETLKALHELRWAMGLKQCERNP